MKFSRNRSALKRNIAGYLFILPWFIGFLVFFLYPLSKSFIFSISKVKITAKAIILTNNGIANYKNIFVKDIYFEKRLIAFLSNTLLSIPVIVVFALIIAIMLNQKIRLKGFFRMIFFLPVIVVSGPVINQLIQQGVTSVPLIEQYGLYGLINNALPKSLAQPITYLFSQMIMILWFSGVQILIFIAGLQKVDSNLYEAAIIDGASAWELFWKITLPALKPMVLVNAVYTLVALSSSEINDVITLIKNNMLNPSTGYGVAAAMAWSYMAVIGFILLIIFLILRDKKEKYLKIKKKRRAII